MHVTYGCICSHCLRSPFISPQTYRETFQTHGHLWPPAFGMEDRILSDHYIFPAGRWAHGTLAWFSLLTVSWSWGNISTRCQLPFKELHLHINIMLLGFFPIIQSQGRTMTSLSLNEPCYSAYLVQDQAVKTISSLSPMKHTGKVTLSVQELLK